MTLLQLKYLLLLEVVCVVLVFLFEVAVPVPRVFTLPWMSPIFPDALAKTNKVYLHMHFYFLPSGLIYFQDFSSFFLHLKQVCILKQLRDAAVSKDNCLSLKTRTLISGGVFLNDLVHIWVTCSVAVSFYHNSHRRMKECHQRQQSAQSLGKLGTKSIAY